MSGVYNPSVMSTGSGNPMAKAGGGAKYGTPSSSASVTAQNLESVISGAAPQVVAPPVQQSAPLPPSQLASAFPPPAVPTQGPQFASVNFTLDDLVEQPDNGVAELAAVLQRYGAAPIDGAQAPQPQHSPPSSLPVAEPSPAPSALPEGNPFAAQSQIPAAPPAPVDPNVAALARSVQQLAQQQHAPAEAPGHYDPWADDRLKLNPADPVHHYVTDLGQRVEPVLSQLQAQVQQLAQDNQRMRYEQHVASTVSRFTPRVAETLAPYGNVPQATIQNIASTAASMMTMGMGEAQALQAAAEPHLPLLRALAGQGGAAPQSMHALPAQTQPSASVGVRQALSDPNLLAAQSAISLSGRTGHQPAGALSMAPTDLPVEVWEAMAFGGGQVH